MHVNNVAGICKVLLRQSILGSIVWQQVHQAPPVIHALSSDGAYHCKVGSLSSSKRHSVNPKVPCQLPCWTV